MENHIHVSKRLFSNQVYFTFLVASLLIHWRFIATVFLVQNDSILKHYGITKDEYLKRLLFDTQEIFSSVVIVFLPFFITWFIIYIVQPRLMPILLQKHKDYEVEKEKIEIRAERKLAEERAKKVTAEAREAEAKIKIIKAEAQSVEADPSIKWERSFLKFKNSSYHHLFLDLVKDFYSGNEHIQDGGFASYLDSIGVINTNPDNPNTIMNFSEKGKYFIRRMNEVETE